MAFSSNQNAIDVHTLLRWICGLRLYGADRAVSREEALEAAQRLNVEANKKMGCGPSPQEIEQRWPGLF